MPQKLRKIILRELFSKYFRARGYVLEALHRTDTIACPSTGRRCIGWCMAWHGVEQVRAPPCKGQAFSPEYTSNIRRPKVRQEEGTQTQTCWSGYLQAGWGFSTWRGGGQTVRYVPRSQGNQTFLAGGISRDFAGISWRCPKSLRKKSSCSIFVPYIWKWDFALKFALENGISLCNPHSTRRFSRLFLREFHREDAV